MRRATLAIACVLWSSAAARTQTPEPSGQLALRGRAAAFLDQLQRAVDGGDRRAVAALVRYPATVLASGFNIPVKDPATLAAIYQAVFTPELRCAIANSEVAHAANPAPAHPVTVSPDGLVIADGAIWAPLKDARYGIARVTVPPPSRVPATRKGVERVTFLEVKGDRTAQFTGWLVRRNVDVYTLSAKSGESIQVRIEGFRGHDATVHVTEEHDATPVVGRPHDTGRTWAGIASTEAHYRIEVVHLAPYCDPAQQYRLSITLR